MRKRTIDAGVWMTMTTGKVPVVRTVCGAFTRLSEQNQTVSFPILRSNHSGWNSSSDVQGWDVKSEWLVPKDSGNSLPRDDSTRIRTTWMKPPSNSGAATAGLVFVLHNETETLARVCAIDARWARGAMEVHHGAYLGAYETRTNDLLPPKGVLFGTPTYSFSFPAGDKSVLGGTISAENEFLESIAPRTSQTIHGINGTISTFENMLLYTWLGTMGWDLDEVNAVTGTNFLERAIALYFVDVLSRIGLHQKFTSFESRSINPNLQLGWQEDDTFLRGGPIFQKPTSFATSTLRQQWFYYGTAWRLDDSTISISIAILGLHMLIVILHFLTLVITARTSEAWDSINDVVALAFNSMPRGAALENCGTGVMLEETLKQKVRVCAVRNDENIKRKVELVFCSMDRGVGDGDDEAGDPNLKPIDVGRRYA